ncbi:hypothetical protein OSSY52_20180 [Tepiditoga spiralis]|uniref:Uncharacterized protein n=1 Tax=Tepiditoga spiralis TaxID=2108365 RepID=A0A7G1GA18_9BACT|nr:hypothetical protein [Tepiditoga spiralis]BBE31877.1 hypothetical protein OSSY52_20180 [Tepiditoga spiralis]
MISKEEKENTIKNFLSILGIMAVIYLLSFFAWQRYELHLKNKIHYPYVQLRDSGYTTVKYYPYKFKNTSIEINLTNKINIYNISTKYGNGEIKTFDSRYFIFENSNFSIIAYPSYEYRGLEYKAFSKKKVLNFIIIPTEEKLNNIFEILETLIKDKKNELIKGENNLIITGKTACIKYEDETYTIPEEVLKVFKSKNYYYFYVLENKFNKVYIANKTQEKIYEIILL